MAVRKIMNTVLQVGPFKFPVAVMTASDKQGGLKFQNVHAQDHGIVKSRRYCADCGTDLGASDVVKEYEFPDGYRLEVTPQDFEDAFGNPTKNFTIKKFVPLKHVNPMLITKSYYIIPKRMDDTGFSAFTNALFNQESAGVVKLFFHSTEHLGLVRAISPNTLVVHQIEYSENLRPSSTESNMPPADVETVDLMEDFISTMEDENSDLSEFKDEFANKMRKVLEDRRTSLSAKNVTNVKKNPAPSSIEDDAEMSVEEIRNLLKKIKN